jgi:hypothetical protein
MSAVVGVYMVTYITAQNMDDFKCPGNFSDNIGFAWFLIQHTLPENNTVGNIRGSVPSLFSVQWS